MMKILRFLAILVWLTFAIGITSVVAGGQKESHSTAPSSQTVLNLQQVQEKQGLTAWGGGVVGGHMGDIYTALLFDSFLKYNADMTAVEPNIATSWKVSQNGTVYTFELRHDVYFQDGVQMKADDIVASLDAVAGNGLTANYGKVLSEVKGMKEYENGTANTISGVQAVGPFTVKFTLLKPSFEFIWDIAYLPILPKHLIWNDVMKNHTLFYQSKFFQKPVGTGPFMIQSRVPGDVDHYVAYKKYWRGRPKIDRVNVWNRNSLVLAKAGKLDFKWVKDPAEIKQLLKIKGMEGYPVAVPTYKRVLWFNMKDSRMQNKKLREAIGLAINREAISQKFYDGFAEPWYSIMSPGSWADPNIAKIPYDPERAKQLIKESNVDTSKPFLLVYYYNTNEARDFVALLQSYLQAIGLTVQTRLLQRNVGKILEQKTENWQMAFGARNALFPGPMLETYTTNAPDSVTDYSNPIVDQLYRQMQKETDANKVRQLSFKIQEIVRQDLPSIQLYAAKSYIVYRKGLHMPVKYHYRFSVPFPIQLINWTLSGDAAK